MRPRHLGNQYLTPWSGQAESNCLISHPKGARDHYAMACCTTGSPFSQLAPQRRDLLRGEAYVHPGGVRWSVWRDSNPHYLLPKQVCCRKHFTLIVTGLVLPLDDRAVFRPPEVDSNHRQTLVPGVGLAPTYLAFQTSAFTRLASQALVQGLRGFRRASPGDPYGSRTRPRRLERPTTAPAEHGPLGETLLGAGVPDLSCLAVTLAGFEPSLTRLRGE